MSERMMNKKELYNSVKMSLEMETEFPRYANARACLIDILGRIDQLEDNEWIDVRNRLPSESGEYLVQWEFDVIKNIEWAVYEDNKWIAIRDSLNITSKVVAWKKIEPYERKEKRCLIKTNL